jgi:hypothetical protein
MAIAHPTFHDRLIAAVQEHQQANPSNTADLSIYPTDKLLSDMNDKIHSVTEVIHI